MGVTENFAQQTAIFKFLKLVDNDRVIPGQMNVGNTIHGNPQALIFMSVVPVSPATTSHGRGRAGIWEQGIMSRMSAAVSSGIGLGLLASSRC
ncbi:MAG: hypothetical protein M0C28_40165 [Candidatus Moduliflexus flocculans]|nr:hypothetical protein [Candidatus Moduliflexus flocculans]